MKIKTLLHKLALEFAKQIEGMGGDPRDRGQVLDFLKGCNLDHKLADIITEELDDE